MIRMIRLHTKTNEQRLIEVTLKNTYQERWVNKEKVKYMSEKNTLPKSKI